MSEYQYYEFRALERSLTAEDQRALRAISSRATITSRSFTNYYSFGNFKGDPVTFMERWFDLHLYFANWGTRTLMIRLPLASIPAATLRQFVGGLDEVEYRHTKEHLILAFTTEVEDDEDESWMLDGIQILTDLVPLRDDLIRGDYRVLYLAWLMGFAYDAYEDDTPEPLPGIGPLTPALAAFAGFFRIDPDLVAVAAARPATPSAFSITPGMARPVLASLPEEEKTDLLVRALAHDPRLAPDLAAIVETGIAARSGAIEQEPPRTVAGLVEAAGARRADRSNDTEKKPRWQGWSVA